MKAARKLPLPANKRPEDEKARHHGNGAGQGIERENNRPHHSARPSKGKAHDSRTAVIVASRNESGGVKIGIPFHATSPAKLLALTRLRDAHPGCSIKIQEERLEKALRRWPLTFREMWELGLQDGRARIYGLKQRGLDITKVWVTIETEYGQRHRVGLYSLRRGGTVPAILPSQPDLFIDQARAGAPMCDSPGTSA